MHLSQSFQNQFKALRRILKSAANGCYVLVSDIYCTEVRLFISNQTGENLDILNVWVNAWTFVYQKKEEEEEAAENNYV